jgi:hypothetical protein
MAPNAPETCAASPRWPAAALALASGKSQVDAATAAGVHPRTVRRWLKRPAFRQRVAELRDGMTSAALGRLTEGMTAAADTLRVLLSDPASRVRLGAARALLSLGLELRQHVELSARLVVLEQRTAESAAA